MEPQRPQSERIVWIDWLRVTACFLVMVVHSSEPFYLNGYDPLILTPADLFWVSLLDSASRMAVPLFIIASSCLLFPLSYTAGEFWRRRARRLLVPFILWSLVYALAWGNPVSNLKDLMLNFNFSAGHLWFVYMLVGLYLIMPLLVFMDQTAHSGNKPAANNHRNGCHSWGICLSCPTHDWRPVPGPRAHDQDHLA